MVTRNALVPFCIVEFEVRTFVKGAVSFHIAYEHTRTCGRIVFSQSTEDSFYVAVVSGLGVPPLSRGTIQTCLVCHVLTGRFCLQDLPEYFEDNMATWMDNFHPLLATDNKLLESDVSALSSSLTYSQSVFDGGAL